MHDRRWRQRSRELAPLALLLLLITACTRLVDAPVALPQREVGPISTAQVANLLSPKVNAVEGNQFDKVEPDRCAPVAREVSPPFLIGRHPAAIDVPLGAVVGELGQGARHAARVSARLFRRPLLYTVLQSGKRKFERDQLYRDGDYAKSKPESQSNSQPEPKPDSEQRWRRRWKF
mgnify:CR=1 FL=1